VSNVFNDQVIFNNGTQTFGNASVSGNLEVSGNIKIISGNLIITSSGGINYKLIVNDNGTLSTILF
jgi:hypothetical protein